MFKIQRKIKCWEGNYWTTDNEWYEWEDMPMHEYATQEQAQAVANKLADNPFSLGYRVVEA